MTAARTPLVVALALSACDDQALNPIWRVDHLRVVAVLADPPDALPGEAVRMRIVTASPTSVTRPTTVVWTLENTFGQGDSFGFTAPTGGPWTVGGFACQGNVRVLGDAPTCDGGEGLAFVRTVRLRGAEANRNPRLASLSLDGTTLTETAPGEVRACPSGECPSHALDVRFADGARDTVHDVLADGTRVDRPESLISAWLVDAGTLDGGFRSDNDVLGGAVAHQNRWIAPATPGITRVWVVVRDGRGGFDALARAIRVLPSTP